MKINIWSQILKTIGATSTKKLSIFAVIAVVILGYPLQIILANMILVYGSPDYSDVLNGRAYVSGSGLCGFGDPSLYVTGTVDMNYTCPGFSVINQATVEGTEGDIGLDVRGESTVSENGFTIYIASGWAYCTNENGSIEDGPFPCPKPTPTPTPTPTPGGGGITITQVEPQYQEGTTCWYLVTYTCPCGNYNCCYETGRTFAGCW